MINKIYRFVKYDGWMHLFHLCFMKFLGVMRLRNSVTYYFMLSKSREINIKNNTKLKFGFIKNEIPLNYTLCGRISLDKANNYLKNNCIMFAGVDNNKIVAYSFIHSKIYKIDSETCFKLDEDENWLGPVFVAKKYRNIGINQYQIQTIIRYLFENGCNKIFTSINSVNYPSIISFMKNGFSMIGLTLKKNKNFKIIDYDKSKNLLQRKITSI